MKKQYLRLLPYLILLIIIGTSCSSEDTENSDTDSVNTINTDLNDKDLSIEEIFEILDEAKFPQVWNYDYIFDIEPYSIITRTTQEYEDQNLIKDAVYQDSIYFVWKKEIADLKLMCIGTFGLYAKGGSSFYYLVTFDNDYNKTDELFFAGIWAVSVENPYGGTSAGEEYQEAELKITDGILTIFAEEATYTLKENGKFIKEIKLIEAVPLSEFDYRFKTFTKFPFILDSEFLEDNPSKDYEKLNAGEVMTLFINGTEIANIYGGEGTVETFIMIDSIKQAGTYDEFVQSDNPGETEESDAFAMYKFKLENNISAYIWSISDATQEMGGPHSSGTIYYISLSKNEKIFSSYPIAEFSSGGDSPMWGERKISAEILKNGTLNITNIDIEGDDDAGTSDTSKVIYNFILKNNKFEEINQME